MKDIVDKLEDLLKQATTEKSHFYVASCCREAIAEIKQLRQKAEGEFYRGKCLGMAEVGRFAGLLEEP